MQLKEDLLSKVKAHFKDYDKKDVAIMILIPSVLIPLYMLYKERKKNKSK